MAYVEVHQAVRDHRKVLDLAVRLDMSEPCVVGHLVFLWLWSVDNSSDGLLPSGSPASVRLIERACGWTGEPGRFVSALVECGLLDQAEDGSLWIHDWYDYMGRLVEKRKSDAERKRHGRRTHRKRDRRRLHPIRREWELMYRKVRDVIFERDGYVCAICKTTEGPFQIDHIIPVARGGQNVPNNLRVLCKPCNQRKGAS